MIKFFIYFSIVFLLSFNNTILKASSTSNSEETETHLYPVTSSLETKKQVLPNFETLNALKAFKNEIDQSDGNETKKIYAQQDYLTSALKIEWSMASLKEHEIVVSTANNPDLKEKAMWQHRENLMLPVLNEASQYKDSLVSYFKKRRAGFLDNSVNFNICNLIIAELQFITFSNKPSVEGRNEFFEIKNQFPQESLEFQELTNYYENYKKTRKHNISFDKINKLLFS